MESEFYEDTMRAMLSDPRLTECERTYLRAAGHLGAAAEVIAEREVKRMLANVEGPCVAHAILPGLLRHDLRPMRDLAESLSAFVAAPDPEAYITARS